nr:hypothetical protein [Mycoplasmopsis bovis]
MIHLIKKETKENIYLNLNSQLFLNLADLKIAYSSFKKYLSSLILTKT